MDTLSGKNYLITQIENLSLSSIVGLLSTGVSLKVKLSIRPSKATKLRDFPLHVNIPLFSHQKS